MHTGVCTFLSLVTSTPPLTVLCARLAEAAHDLLRQIAIKIFTRGKTQMSRLHFAHVLFVLLLIVASTTVLQAQAPLCPSPCPTPCPSPCQAPVPSTYGAWEAYVFGGATTHSNHVFNGSFVANGTTFDTRLRMPGAATFGG